MYQSFEKGFTNNEISGPVLNSDVIVFMIWNNVIAIIAEHTRKIVKTTIKNFT